ncbi:hypothetical protein B0I29_10113 [Actinoplanes lutulentus]|uniref:NB-ARC domain-containing protein n=2 Tax=Actinoplanes lutulentus TaxID=1287878 RepID=A0A327ZJP5_9ACTN|nr:hypothetical protein B0I29_10113 [Actinoplanes lutulentus]
MLGALAGTRAHACRIEGDPHALVDADAVDFDLVDDNGRVLLAAQVKSRSEGKKVGVAEACSIFIRLVRRAEADKYLLLTDALEGSGIADLRATLTRTDLRRELKELLASSHRTQALVADLSDVEIERLRRCEVDIDPRERDEILEGLRRHVRNFRRRVGQAIGPDSSGLLVSCLIAETLERAAEPHKAVWLFTDLQRTLRLSPAALAQALTIRDWGVIVGVIPPIPDVARNGLMRAIGDTFSAPDRDAGTVIQLVLSGPSGIGKSSLAAGYIAASADRYDVIAWIDGSSESTLRESFGLLVSWLGVSPPAEDRALKELVHRRLGLMTGRWLLIVDDSQSTESESWIPRLGSGDILFTTLNSATGYTRAQRLTVPPMEPSESHALLTARLGQAFPDTTALTSALDHWPLAIELAAGYLTSCGYEPEDVPLYLDKLRLRAMDDSPSVPEGYPRTLVAATNLCLARLAETAAPSALFPYARDCLVVASYLAQRRIPIHLLVAAVGTDPATVPAQAGPLFSQDPQVPEIFRLLKSVSFIRDDEPLPPSHNDASRARQTITLNSILQEIVRNNAERLNVRRSIGQVLSSAAFYINLWLQSAIHNGENDRVLAVAPHADVLHRHVTRLHIADNHVAIMIGNLAAFHSAQDNNPTARNLLEAELLILEKIDDPNLHLLEQARIYFAVVVAQEDSGDSDTAEKAITHLEAAIPFLFRLAADAAVMPEAEQAASFMCGQALQAAEQLYANRARPRATPVLTALRELSLRLPKHPTISAREAVERASLLIDVDKLREAESICRDSLSRESAGAGSLYLEVRRVLVEALAQQGRWDDAQLELDALFERMGTSPLYNAVAATTLHNLGLFAATQILVGDSRRAHQFFSNFIKAPQFTTVRGRFPVDEAWRYDVLDVAYAVAQGDLSKARHLADQISRKLPISSKSHDDMGWRVLFRTFAGIAEGLNGDEAAEAAFMEEARLASMSLDELSEAIAAGISKRRTQSSDAPLSD